jgi:ribonuclease D
VAAKRLARVRAAVTKVAETVSMPAENLVPPDSVRRIAWNPPALLDTDRVRAALTATGARPWQVALVADALSAALPEPPPPSVPAPTAGPGAAPDSAPASDPASPE